MAVTFSQEPAELAVVCVAGDELSIALTVGPTNARVNLTGYTLEAKVFTPVFANPSGEMADGAYTVGAIAATFAVGAVNLSQGQVAISLTETQTAALSPAVGYRWYFRAQDATGYTLTWLSGSFTARIP